MRSHRRPGAGRSASERNPVRRGVFRHSMTGTTRSIPGPPHRARHLLGFAALCAALIGLAVASSAGAISAKVIGKTHHTPHPDCPKTPCSAIGSVTGFQLAADGKKRPFNVHKNGKIVAWSLDLSKPSRKQRNFFGNFYKSDKFGMTPTARLAVIKHKGRKKYKLLRQSPVVKLSGTLGRREIFTLDKPLRVRKGQIVALTIPTWASAFATELGGGGNQWRASRAKGKCNSESDIKAGRPQQRVDSIRNFGCDYKTARLLYWAYYVPR
jgi:hypothetical protein